VVYQANVQIFFTLIKTAQNIFTINKYLIEYYWFNIYKIFKHFELYRYNSYKKYYAYI